MRKDELLMAACRYIVALLVVLSLSGPCNARVPSSHYPQRIISLTPGITEILFALGLGNKVVGDTTYCDYPAAAKLKPHVGDVATNYEAVLTLHPDLVIADGIANAQALPRLQALHLPLLIVQAKTLEDVERNIKLIGAATGSSAAANAVVRAILLKQTRAIESRAHVQGSLRALVIVDDNPLYVAGPDSFVGAMISQAGAKNIAYGGFSAYSKESAIAADPQVIFCEEQEAHVLRRDPAWSQTSAVRRGNVFTVDANILVRPGPRLVDGLCAIAFDLNHVRS